MKRDTSVYIQHILGAVLRIEEYLNDVDERRFQSSTLIQDGVIRQLEVIGEAIKQLPEEFRTRYPDIPWKDYAGMRDKLIHHYFGVDLDTVWLTTQDDIPFLKRRLLEIQADVKQYDSDS